MLGQFPPDQGIYCGSQGSNGGTLGGTGGYYGSGLSQSGPTPTMNAVLLGPPPSMPELNC
jgi:hypothetical protein